jgi:peroxiredoxin
MNNKGIILLLVFAVCISSLIVLMKSGASPEKRAVTGSEAPGFELKDTEGRPWKLSDLKGKVVFLNFWASWCSSCMEENPSLQKLFTAENGNDKFVLMTVIYNDDPAKAAAYMKQNGLSFPVLVDTVNLAKTYGITGVPETFVIDTKGTLVRKVIGPMQWDTPDVHDLITKLIAGK